MSELSTSIKRDLLNQEITNYQAQKYMCEVRYRVMKGLKDLDQMKALENDMVRCEQAIDILSDELKSLETPSGTEVTTEVKKEGQSNG